MFEKEFFLKHTFEREISLELRGKKIDYSKIVGLRKEGKEEARELVCIHSTFCNTGESLDTLFLYFYDSDDLFSIKCDTIGFLHTNFFFLISN